MDRWMVQKQKTDRHTEVDRLSMSACICDSWIHKQVGGWVHV